jgi:hypothetical protein
MSGNPPPNWPPQPSPNPFAEQPSGDPFAPGAHRPGQPLPDLADDPAMRWVLPVGQSVWSIASGYLGLLSLALCFLGPFAVFTGVMAIAELRKNPRMSGWGRAIIGIVLGTLGSIGLVVLIIVLIADS